MRLVIALLVVAAAASAQQTCSADGTVIDHVTRQPVPRAKVRIAERGLNRTATADNSGRWTLLNLPCATLILAADRFDYLDSSDTERGDAAVHLAPGSPAYVTLEITPQAVITGKVVDENGDPVPGMRMAAYVARVVEGRRVLANAPQAVTDDRGEFRIARLEPASYIVCAEPAPSQNEYGEACSPAPVEDGPANAMKIAPGQEGEFDFTLRRIRAVRVSSVISGLPPGATATVYLSRGAGPTLRPGMAANAGPDGKFTVAGVAPGSYWLTGIESSQGINAPFGRATLEVGPDGVDDVSLSLEPPVTISGTVRFELQDSATAAGASIQLALRSSEPHARVGSVEWSDDKRLFTISGITPGNYSLGISGPGYVKSATLASRDISRDEFAIGAGSGPMEIVISDNGGVLEGDVVLDDGSAAPFTHLVLFRDGRFARTFSAESSHFMLNNLRPGEYTVYAWDNLDTVEYANPDWMRQNAAAGVPLTIDAGQHATVKVTRQTAGSEY